MPPDHQLPAITQRRKRFNVPGGYKAATLILLLVILAMVLVWRPWEANVKAADRTISVTGSSTVTAAPDQYLFSPSYSFTNADKQAALNDLSKKSDDIVGKLKSLGVASGDIKTNSNGYGNIGIYTPVDTGVNSYTLSLEVTVHNPALAQKVQDYLVTTTPTGQVSPDVTFSNALQQQLQNQARQKAEQNARSQADQSATNLGFKVAAVKSVVDGSLDTGYPLVANSDNLAQGTNGAATIKPKLSVQPGKNDLNYSVQVVYYIH